MKLNENVGWGLDKLTDRHGATVGRVLRMGTVLYVIGRKSAVNESECLCGLESCGRGCLCDCEGECSA